MSKEQKADREERGIVYNLDDIIFKNRNKEYGAYAIRKNYFRVLLLSLLLGNFILLSGIELYKFSDYWTVSDTEKEGIVNYDREVVVELNDELSVGEKKYQERLGSPPSLTLKLPKGAPRAPEVMFVVPRVVAHSDAVAHSAIPDVTYLDTVKAEIGIRNVKGDPTARPTMGLLEEGTVFVRGSSTGVAEEKTPIAPAQVPPSPKKEAEEDPDPNKFIVLEVKPSPLNLDVIKKRLVYPTLCREAGIEGKVYVRMLVNKNGRVEKTIIQKSPHPLLSEECLRHIDSLQFNPGIQGGKPVKVWVSIPFEFQLK
jgi:protein TonB